MTLSITEGLVFDEAEANAHGFHVVEGDEYVTFDADVDQPERQVPCELDPCPR